MSRLFQFLAALAAGGLLASALPATASAPVPASGSAARHAGSVRTITWSTAVNVEGTYGFELRLPRVPAGDYAATMSGAITAGKSELFCALVIPRTERTLLADVAPGGEGGLHIVDASRTIHLGVTQDLYLVCSSAERESYASSGQLPIQVSLTRVDRLAQRSARVQPVKTVSSARP